MTSLCHLGDRNTIGTRLQSLPFPGDARSVEATAGSFRQLSRSTHVLVQSSVVGVQHVYDGVSTVDVQISTFTGELLHCSTPVAPCQPHGSTEMIRLTYRVDHKN